MTDRLDRKALLLLVRLTRRESRFVREAGDRFFVVSSPRKTTGETVDAPVISMLAARGFIAPCDDGLMTITAAGVAAARRQLSGADAFAEQHQERARITVEDADFGRRQITINHHESPLAWLRRRKDRNGRPMIDANAFAAGERLRCDYERAHLMPRMTADWTAPVAGKRRSAGAGGIADLTESALAARRRVEAALAALDPELGGIAVDFCCFLKGLEQIERERQWPARSAKVVLRLALAALARHYGLASRAKGPSSGKLRHWGAEGYRPTID